MLADMEGTSDPLDAVRELERAEAAPYVRLPPAPSWVAPVFGAWFAGWVGMWALWGWNRIAFAGASVLLIMVLGGIVRATNGSAGAVPVLGRGTPPPEIARLYRAYVVGCLVVAAAVALVWWWAGIGAAAAATLVLVTAGLARYATRYEQAASAVRARLG
jgi:hypothetical protein